MTDQKSLKGRKDLREGSGQSGKSFGVEELMEKIGPGSRIQSGGSRQDAERSNGNECRDGVVLWPAGLHCAATA